MCEWSGCCYLEGVLSGWVAWIGREGMGWQGMGAGIARALRVYRGGDGVRYRCYSPLA